MHPSTLQVRRYLCAQVNDEDSSQSAIRRAFAWKNGNEIHTAVPPWLHVGVIVNMINSCGRPAGLLNIIYTIQYTIARPIN